MVTKIIMTQESTTARKFPLEGKIQNLLIFMKISYFQSENNNSTVMLSLMSNTVTQINSHLINI